MEIWFRDLYQDYTDLPNKLRNGIDLYKRLVQASTTDAPSPTLISQVPQIKAINTTQDPVLNGTTNSNSSNPFINCGVGIRTSLVDQVYNCSGRLVSRSQITLDTCPPTGCCRKLEPKPNTSCICPLDHTGNTCTKQTPKCEIELLRPICTRLNPCSTSDKIPMEFKLKCRSNIAASLLLHLDKTWLSNETFDGQFIYYAKDTSKGLVLSSNPSLSFKLQFFNFFRLFDTSRFQTIPLTPRHILGTDTFSLVVDASLFAQQETKLVRSYEHIVGGRVYYEGILTDSISEPSSLLIIPMREHLYIKKATMGKRSVSSSDGPIAILSSTGVFCILVILILLWQVFEPRISFSGFSLSRLDARKSSNTIKMLRNTFMRPSALRSCRSMTTVSKEIFTDMGQGENQGIVTISMNRPAKKNAIGKAFLTQLGDSLDAIRHNRQVRVVILRSLVPKVFCAGADLQERLLMTPSEVDAFVYQLRSTFNHFSLLPIPTIAAIDGAALGGGLELAMAADMRVAGETALLGLPETKLAIIPGAGGTQRLPRLVGLAKAKELIFTGRRLSPKEAQDIGLVNYAVQGSSYDKALELAKEIIPQGPVAVRMAKVAMDRGSEMDIASGLALEQACYGNVIPTKDRLEGLTAFKEKRTPQYKGE